MKVVILPPVPSVLAAIDVKLFSPAGKDKVSSRKRNPDRATNPQRNRIKPTVGINPAPTPTIGSAKIPPPIEVPMINMMHPMILPKDMMAPSGKCWETPFRESFNSFCELAIFPVFLRGVKE